MIKGADLRAFFVFVGCGFDGAAWLPVILLSLRLSSHRPASIGREGTCLECPRWKGRWRDGALPINILADINLLTYKIPESVLVVIHSADLQVLLIERADRPGYWQSVTGSKDSLEEPLIETAAREVFEETGIRVVSDARNPTPRGNEVAMSKLRDWQLSNIYEIYPVWRHRYAPGVTRNTEHVFGLVVPRDIPITLAPREHINHVWLPYREAADKCFSPSNAEAILQLPEYVKTQ